VRILPTHALATVILGMAIVEVVVMIFFGPAWNPAGRNPDLYEHVYYVSQVFDSTAIHN